MSFFFDNFSSINDLIQTYLDAFLHIYILLLLAMIMFGMAVILATMNVFNDGISLIKKRFAQIRHKQILFLKLKTGVYPDFKPDFDGNVIFEAAENLLKNEARRRRGLNLLNPKRQIITFYSLLFLSLGLISFDVLVRENYMGLYSHRLSVLLIGLSVSIYIIMMTFAAMVAFKIIEVKTLLHAQSSAIKVPGSFRVTEIVGTNVLRVEPAWEYDNNQGDTIIIKGYEILGSDEKKRYVKALLKELLVKPNVRIELANPDYPPHKGVHLECHAWLEAIDLADYLPEYSKNKKAI